MFWLRMLLLIQCLGPQYSSDVLIKAGPSSSKTFCLHCVGIVYVQTAHTVFSKQSMT